MSLPHNPARAARRKAELREKLGIEQPVCSYCGCAEPVVLRRVSRKFLERNHLLGRKHDPNLTVFACRNCHALFHERLLNAGVDLRAERDPVKRVAVMLLAEAVQHEMQADTKRRQATLLKGGKRASRSLPSCTRRSSRRQEANKTTRTRRTLAKRLA